MAPLPRESVLSKINIIKNKGLSSHKPRPLFYNLIPFIAFSSLHSQRRNYLQRENHLSAPNHLPKPRLFAPK